MVQNTNRKFFGWWVVAGGFILNFIGIGIGINAIGVFFKPVVDSLGFGRGDFSLYFTIAALSMTVAAPVVGKLLETFSVRAIMGFSTVNMYDGAEFWGGSGSLLTVSEHATLNIYAGRVSCFFGAKDSSTVNLYGGVLIGFGLSDQAVLNVFSGKIYTDGFWWENTVASTATVNIYGSGFEFDPEGAWWQEICSPEAPDCGGHWISKLTGYDVDGDPVTYWGLPDPATHPNIQIIPEPTTLLLFLSGTTLMAVMRRRHP